MAKISNLFSRLTRAQFDAQLSTGGGFEDYCIVFISDEKKIWNKDVFYGLSEEEEQAILLYQSKLGDDLTTPEAHGGLPAGSKVSDLKKKTLSELFDAILFPVIQPTVTPPSASITPKDSWKANGVYEVGAAAPQTANFTTGFNKGKATVPGQPTLDRAGEQTSLKITHNGSESLPATVTAGAMEYVVTVEYGQGTELKDSHGNKATTDPNPLPAGSVTSKTTIYGVYPFFCNGASASDSQPDTNFPNSFTPNTKLPLVAPSDNIIGMKFASEVTHETHMEFLFPKSRTISKVEFYNTAFNKWDVVNAGRYEITDAGQQNINGTMVDYSKLTTKGSFVGALQYRVTLSTFAARMAPIMLMNDEIMPLAASTGNREPGFSELAINFEPKSQAPLDARTVVPTKADLINPDTYADKNYFKGMPVFVLADESAGGEVTLYVLKDPAQITSAGYEGWKRIDVGDAQSVVNIINDLTTGGADKALSAEQGKVLKGFIDALQNNTVNGKKISENPVLSGADIALTGYVKSVLESVELAIAETDTVNVAIGKLEKRADDADANLVAELAKKLDVAKVGVADGVASLDSNGQVPSTQLPSYVDDVIEFQQTYADKASIPTSGLTTDALYYAVAEKLMFKATSDTAIDEGTKPESGKIYIAVAEGNDYLKQYRWGGDSAGLVQITSGNLVLGEAANTAYEGSKGKANADLLASLGAKLITSVDAPTADADKVTFNYKAISKTTNFDPEAPATVEIPAATETTAGVLTANDKKNLDILITIMGGDPEDPEKPINPDLADYLKKSDAGIGVLKEFTKAAESAEIASGDTLAVALGKIVLTLDTLSGGNNGALPTDPGQGGGDPETPGSITNIIKQELGKYTVNKKAINTNPVLNGADIALDGFEETADGEPADPNNIKAADTVNAALKKAQNRIEALEALLDWYEGE